MYALYEIVELHPGNGGSEVHWARADILIPGKQCFPKFEIFSANKVILIIDFSWTLTYLVHAY